MSYNTYKTPIYSEQKILCEKFKSQVINFQIIVIFKFCKSFSVGYKITLEQLH